MTQIHIRVTDEKNVSKAAFLIDAPSTNITKDLIEMWLEQSLRFGSHITTEMLTYDLEINGVKLQKGIKT